MSDSSLSSEYMVPYTMAPEVSEDPILLTKKPVYKKIDSDACYNIIVMDNGNLTYSKAGILYLVYNTGVRFLIPEGYNIKMYPRSSIRNTVLTLCNCVPIVDQDYTGSVFLSYRVLSHRWLFSIYNLLRFITKRNIPFPLAYVKGDYAAQFEVCKNSNSKIVSDPDYYNKTAAYIKAKKEASRGDRGHGSTGN